VAGSAATLEFVDNGAPTDVEVRHVVVLDEVDASAVHASPVSFANHSLLSGCRMPLACRGVDWAALGIMNQGSQEGIRRKPFHHGAGNRRPIIE